MTLGQYIKQFRKQNNMTMEEFASRAELTKAYISMLENGYKTRGGKSPAPSVSTYNKCANAMELSFNDLVAAVDDTISLSVKEEKPAPVQSELYDELYQEVFNMLLQLPAEDIPLVVAYIQGLRAKREG